VARPRYREGLVVAVFVAAALVASRNLAVASIVLVPVLARAWPEVGSIRSDRRDGLGRGVAAVACVLAVVLVAVRLDERHLALAAYPVASIERLEELDVDLTSVRLGGPERVGNLLELRDGATGSVFADDRFDMFPDALAEDMVELLGGRPDVDQVLDRWDLDLVLWPRNAALSQILGADPDWRILHEEEAWLLYCRSGARLSSDLTCS
jgi:hypothetical protein